MKIASNGLRFEVETAGDDSAPAVLLTMGLGMQLTAWPERLLTALVNAGCRVIRYDNRDRGLSSHLDALGEPHLLWQFVRSRQLLAIMTDLQRHTLLPHIACPTLVLHGAVDPLVPMACGQDTAARIPGARFEAIQGMGHDWPPGVATLLANHIVPHLNAATAPQPA